MDHLDFIHIAGFDGGETECFQGLSSGSVTFAGTTEGASSTTTASVNLDLAPLIEALAPLQELTSLTPLPVDLSPVIEALAPLSYLEHITPLDLTEMIEKLSEISNKMVAYDLSGITQALEELRDHVAALAFVDAKIDFGFFKVWLMNRILQA